MKRWEQKQTGFTIVELLIVIVVIAILAAVTIVAYNGIRQSAQSSALQSNLSQNAKQLATWKVPRSEQYPADLSAARADRMLVDSAEATYVKYLVSPDRLNYCATAKDGRERTYSITSRSGAPVPGECVENLIQNPSFELNTASGWTPGGATPTVTRLSGGQMGQYRVALTKASPVNDAQYNHTGPLNGNTNYSIAYWSWSDTSTCSTGNQFSRNNAGFQPFMVISGTVTTTPQVYRAKGVSPSDASQFRWRIVPCNDGSSTVYYDGFTAVEASFDLKVPYDGDSPGWFWTGAPHASTSIGPAEAL